MAPPATPPPPPGPGLLQSPDAPPPPPEAGGAAGLFTVAPTAEERACTVRQCLVGIPESVFPMYEPTARFQIPYTGGFSPRARNWTVFAGESLTYDSNIFASDNNVQSDWISNTSAGASYRQEGSTFWALATASLTYSAFFDHTEESNLNVYGDFQFGWKGAAFYASIEDMVGYLQNPIVVRDNTFVIIDQSLDSYWINTLKARAGYECARYRAELSYEFDLFNAGNDAVVSAFNNTEQYVTLRGDYYVSDKTSVGLYGRAGFVPYTDPTQDDYSTYDLGPTFSWRPLAKLGLMGSLGYAWLNSDGGPDRSTFVGNLDISYDPTSTISTFLGWERSYQPSLGADDQIVDLYRVRGTALFNQCWTGNVSTGFQVGNTEGASLDGAKDYTLFFFDAMIHHPLGPNWAVDAGYQFRKQTSQDNGIDFNQNRVTVGVTFAF